MNNLSVAVIGAGRMAREHIKAFQAIPGVRVTGLLSRTVEKANTLAKEFGINFVAHSIEELHKSTKADLVIITVPELEANHVAKNCFQYDWAVLMEKPAGYDLSDAHDIAEAALVSKRPVYVGLNRRFYSSSRIVSDDLNSRDSEKRYIHIQDQQSFAEAINSNQPDKVVQKYMYANSIHTIDLMRFFARGEVTKVVPILPWNKKDTQVLINYLEFDSGDTALYECIWKGPGPWACSISTTSKRWVMQPLETARFQNLNERVVNDIAIDDCDKLFKAGFYKQALEVCQGVRGLPHQAVTIQESLKTMDLIHLLYGE